MMAFLADYINNIMTLVYQLVTALTLAAIAQSINVTTAHIANRHPSNGCLLIITNDEEVLDLRTSCPIEPSEGMNLPVWLELIDMERAYLLQDTTNFLGYRYFKNKLNYKYLPAKLTAFEQTLSNFLKTSHLEIPFPFE